LVWLLLLLLSVSLSPLRGSLLFFLLKPRPPRSTLFPYTTLFRSGPRLAARRPGRVSPAAGQGARQGRPRGTRPDAALAAGQGFRSEEHTSELQSLTNLVCRLLLEKQKLSYPILHQRPHTQLRPER